LPIRHSGTNYPGSAARHLQSKWRISRRQRSTAGKRAPCQPELLQTFTTPVALACCPHTRLMSSTCSSSILFWARVLRSSALPGHAACNASSTRTERSAPRGRSTRPRNGTSLRPNEGVHGVCICGGSKLRPGQNKALGPGVESRFALRNSQHSSRSRAFRRLVSSVVDQVVGHY